MSQFMFLFRRKLSTFFNFLRCTRSKSPSLGLALPFGNRCLILHAHSSSSTVLSFNSEANGEIVQGSGERIYRKLYFKARLHTRFLWRFFSFCCD